MAFRNSAPRTTATTLELASAGGTGRKLFALVRTQWAAVLFVALALAALIWVSDTLFMRGYATASTKSDYWEHTAALRALIEHPWHPGNPHLATNDASPRFTPEFVLLALVARTIGVNAFDAMALAGTVNVAVLLAGVYAFYRMYFQDARAPLYGLIVALASWLEGFRYSSVYQLSVLFEVAGYPSTFAVGCTFVTFAVVLRALRGEESRWWFALVGLSMTNVVLTHALTATMTLTGTLALAWFEPGIARRRRWLVMGSAVTGCFLALLWPYFSIWQTVHSGDDVNTSWASEGLLAHVQDNLEREPHHFYLQGPLFRTVGFAALGLYALVRFVRSGRHTFVVVGALVMLAPFVLNRFIELPLGHRFILLVIPYLQMGTVWLMLRATPGFHEGWWQLHGPPWRRYAAIAGVVALLGAMVAINVYRGVRVNQREVSHEVIRLCHDVAKAAGPNAVVLADPKLSWPLPACGVKVVALFHPNPLVPDDAARLNTTYDFMDRKLSRKYRDEILRKYGVTHLLTERKAPKRVRRYAVARGTARRLRGGYVLYRIH